MAMSLVIGRTSHTVVPLALRAVATSRILTGSHVNKALIGEDQFVISNKYFSTASDARKLVDRKLSQVLKSDIKSVKWLDIQVPHPPAHFPFEIEDNRGKYSIKLTRELDGEKIEVEVESAYDRARMHDDYVYASDDGNSSTESSSDDEDERELRLAFKVLISKDNGTPLLSIETEATVQYIDVQFVTLFEDTNKETPIKFFQTADENKDMKRAWRSFLEVRGIEKAIIGYLIEYMVKKRKRDKLLFLKKFREYVIKN